MERCRAFILEHYQEHGRLEDAFAALVELARSDPQRHLEIVGRRHPMAERTYRHYWLAIPLARRQAARAEARRREAERRAEKSDR
jgi:hypothetical protein